MSERDIWLLTLAVAAVVLLVTLIVSRARMHPFLALLISSLAAGFAAELDPQTISKSIVEGAGHTLGAVGLVVALGAMLGKILSDSGVTREIADAILKRSSDRALPWAMAGAAFVVGIPMFFEVGLVVLLPLIFSVARRAEEHGVLKGSAYVWIGGPAIAALAAMHGMVPPHPGPLTALAALHASVPPAMIYGFIAAIPAIALGGPIYAGFIAPRLATRPDRALLDQFTAAPATGGANLGFGLAALLTPVLLMLFRAVVATAFDKQSGAAKAAEFLGDPVIAMLAGVLLASVTLVYARGGDAAKLRAALGDSLKPIVGILLIIAGGGAFQEILVKAHVGDAIVHMARYFSAPPLILGWLVAMLLSVSTGSATVGIVGAAGLLTPLSAADPNLNLALLALAIGCGSLFFNYANHAGFWLVKEAFGMDMREATWTISIIQSIVSLVGLVMVLLMNLLPPLRF
jgi:gluconate:H+ symporter, GntP family